MSTYNGEKYLREQIDSILAQKEVKIELLVRDDGSSDNTIAILDEYKEKKLLDWYDGENLGPARSFLDLLIKAGEYDYYAFSDQDDYWIPEKLNVAIKKLEDIDENIPAVYFSNKEIVDEHLENGRLADSVAPVVSFRSSIVRNIATGCTMVFNAKLRDKVLIYQPKYLEMHDSWIYRVCLAIKGRAIYDGNAYIKYRQHSRNVIGANDGVLVKIERRTKKFFDPDHEREKVSKELLKGYANFMYQADKDWLEDLKRYRTDRRAKKRLLRDKSYKTEKVDTNFIYKLALRFGKV